MAYDPLSRPTRTKQNSILVIGSASYLASEFNIKIDAAKLPLKNIPETLLIWVLIIATIYLYVSYVSALYDDLSTKKTPREIEARDYEETKAGLGRLLLVFSIYEKSAKEEENSKVFEKYLTDNMELLSKCPGLLAEASRCVRSGKFDDLFDEIDKWYLSHEDRQKLIEGSERISKVSFDFFNIIIPSVVVSSAIFSAVTAYIFD